MAGEVGPGQRHLGETEASAVRRRDLGLRPGAVGQADLQAVADGDVGGPGEIRVESDLSGAQSEGALLDVEVLDAGEVARRAR
ncbi:hypothetical protein [Streptomyces sp. NPDC055134]